MMHAGFTLLASCLPLACVPFGSECTSSCGLAYGPRKWKRCTDPQSHRAIGEVRRDQLSPDQVSRDRIHEECPAAQDGRVPMERIGGPFADVARKIVHAEG